MSKLQINQIAQVSAGYPFRTSLNNVLGDEIKVIQAKDIKTGILVNADNATSIVDQGFQGRFFVKGGDVLLSARGNLRAGVVSVDNNKSIASFSVYILRLIINKVKPEYLAIFLNSTQGQRLLGERSTGLTIRTILRKDLENIKVNVPSLEKQQQIIDIYENNQKQQKLLEQKAFLTNKISEGAINKLLTN